MVGYKVYIEIVGSFVCERWVRQSQCKKNIL